jgi:hypothetical protein
VAHESTGFGGLSEAERTAVRAELDLITSDRLFDHSKRYPVFLRYVVEKTLDGSAAELKERVIGIEALGRPPAYDSSQDPVVRTTAAEVRKRLAHYYQHTDRAPSVRIDIPVGSYVPQFTFAGAEAPAVAAPRVRSSLSRRAALGLLPVAALFPAVLYLGAFSPRPIEQFWDPFLNAGESVAICVGPATGSNGVETTGMSGTPLVTLNAATTASRVVGFLQEQGKLFELKPVESVDFEELRARPVILIGGFNNRWTMRAIRDLRFRFERNSAGRAAIVDAERPAGGGWTRRFTDAADARQLLEDFALVARLRDPSTGQHLLVVAGIGVHGTSAGGEFVARPKYLADLAATLPRGWERQNVELVLATTITDNVAGPPRVVASHVWQ